MSMIPRGRKEGRGAFIKHIVKRKRMKNAPDHQVTKVIIDFDRKEICEKKRKKKTDKNLLISLKIFDCHQN